MNVNSIRLTQENHKKYFFLNNYIVLVWTEEPTLKGQKKYLNLSYNPTAIGN